MTIPTRRSRPITNAELLEKASRPSPEMDVVTGDELERIALTLLDRIVALEVRITAMEERPG